MSSEKKPNEKINIGKVAHVFLYTVHSPSVSILQTSICAIAVNDHVISGIVNLCTAQSLSNKGPKQRVKEYWIEMSFSINVKHKRRP